MYHFFGATRPACAKHIHSVTRALLCMLVLLATPLSAQITPWSPPPSTDDAIPITIVLVDNGSPAGLLRRAAVEPRNVILLDSATVDARALSDAVFSMLIMEAVDGAGRRRSNNEIQRASLSAAHPVYPWADEGLHRLLGAAKEPVRGVGRYRSISIWMPPLRGAASN
jgi:hypothetical protein